LLKLEGGQKLIVASFFIKSFERRGGVKAFKQANDEYFFANTRHV